MLAQTTLDRGGRPSVNQSPRATGLSEIGVNKSQSSRWQLIAANAEIQLRAVRRIGELSKALETAHKVGQGSEVQLPASGKLKAAALKAAGLSTSVAHRCAPKRRTRANPQILRI
jgi:hypothetical protein